MGDTETVRIAMWSGPRNISTAMMRSFENRPDTRVIDEPLYAAYLSMTGIDHPMRDEVIASGIADWRRAVAELLSTGPEMGRIIYQKQMTHHMLPEIAQDRLARDWIAGLRNAFLIRRPQNVLASYVRKREAVTLEDTGFLQQAELFDVVADALGEAPVVVDARDVLENPRGMLTALCDGLGIPFSEAMLSWPPGFRETDGVWKSHWYEAVAASTGFSAPNPDVDDLPPHLLKIAESATPAYRRLAGHKLAPAA